MIPTRAFLLPLLAGLAAAPQVVRAGSISTAGYAGGPDSNAAKPNPAAIHYNPAAIAATEGVQVLVDGQFSFIRIDIEATRNEGIDPNTGEPYGIAQARVMVPNAVAGVTWKAIPDRLALGFAVTDALVGGGDYTAGEPDDEAPYESHQRYAGVISKIMTIHLTPAVGVTVIPGLHVGGAFKYILDSVTAIQASDPLGSEGLGPDGAYSADTILEIHASGGHVGWSAGVFFDRFEKFQIGASYIDNGTFTTEGDGSVDAPDMVGGGNPEAVVSFEGPLAPMVEAWARSQVTDTLEIGAGIEAQLWGTCCGAADGDFVIGITSTDGDPIGADPEDGILVQVADTQYSPRRLENMVNVYGSAGWQASDRLWLGLKGGYHPHAVPDYAVSATNLDFTSVGAQLGFRVRIAGDFEAGVAYSKYFLFDREITNSAWDVRDPDDPDYVDDRFSPKNPYKASANGLYSGLVDTVGVRLQAKF
ncbi:MAG: outer membrane protein transport protein [Deltaproteobacteria bacterium]|nr:outer membrane protein transport protein [Deltaproteobacteria bacterium]